MAVKLAKTVRKSPDPLAISTKGLQTSYESSESDGQKPSGSSRGGC